MNFLQALYKWFFPKYNRGSRKGRYKMGGDREGFLASEKDKPAKPDAPPAPGVAGVIGGGDIRYHQSGNEVHFHDDKNKIKCAVPVAEMWKAWEKLRTQPGSWEWVDTENSSHLFLQTQVNLPEFKLRINLMAVKPDRNFVDFNKFVKRK